MKEPLIVIVVILLFLLFSGNFTAFFQVFEILKQVFVGFFPIFSDVGKMALEEYIKSPYFITGVIMAIASAFGIWFGKKGGKALLLVVSIICEIASVVSICANIF